MVKRDVACFNRLRWRKREHVIRMVRTAGKTQRSRTINNGGSD